MADEHQVWSHQARLLHISIPPGTTPSGAGLRDWVISRTRVDLRWIRSGPGRLTPHSFEKDTEFVDARLIPGGNFFVLYLRNRGHHLEQDPEIYGYRRGR